MALIAMGKGGRFSQRHDKGHLLRAETSDSSPQSDAHVLFLGKAKVGKSALIVRFLTKRFIGEYDNTLDSRHIKQITMNEKDYVLELLDPGQLDKPSEAVRRGRIMWADGFVLVYSVTSRRSFEEIPKLYQYIDKIRPQEKPPIIIIGNKVDLQHERKISTEQGRQLAAQLKCSHYETSAAVLHMGYERLIAAMSDVVQEVLRRTSRRRTSKARRASLSPKPLRNALVKMFSRTKDDSDLQTTDV